MFFVGRKERMAINMEEHRLPHDHGETTENIVKHLPDTEKFAVIAEIFRQLGDISRIRIFWMLCHCEECVINLSAAMEMTSPAISHHLKQLKTAGLIISRREGKEVYYKAADNERVKVLHDMIEIFLAITCPADQ